MPGIWTLSEEDIVSFIQENLPINKTKKDTNGEVFTPVPLVENILDALPSEVWTNPHLKWLDPANGVGNFPLLVFLRLDKSLARWQPDKKKRRQHIIRNMLYMVELDTHNVSKSRKIFGPDANIRCADFLDPSEPPWGEFDIILGNPPFNSTRTSTGGVEQLWPKFVSKSIELLSPNGYLAFLHPPAWRKPGSELFALMTKQNRMLCLHIQGESEGRRMFGIQTRFDWYVLRRGPSQPRFTTEVVDQEGHKHTVRMADWAFLPNHSFAKIRAIVSKYPQEYVIYSRNQFRTDNDWTSERKHGKYVHPLIHTTPESGPRMYWANTKEPDVSNPVPMFGVPKVVFGDGRKINEVVLDTTGKYGMTQHAIGLKIRSREEGEKLKRVLESDAFANILDAMSFSHFQIDWRIFTVLRRGFYLRLLDTNQHTRRRKQRNRSNTTYRNR